MKQITFWAQPYTSQELTTNVSDEDWASLEDHLYHGEPLDFIFQKLWKTHDFTLGKTTILPNYEAWDYMSVDCDCEETKKRPITPQE